MEQDTGPASQTPQDTTVQVSPLAVVVRGHCAAKDLHDPNAPIFCDPRDLALAGELDRIDARCGSCASVEAISCSVSEVTITTGHAAGCPWWEPLLADMMARDGAAVEAFAASLHVTGGPAA